MSSPNAELQAALVQFSTQPGVFAPSKQPNCGLPLSLIRHC